MRVKEVMHRMITVIPAECKVREAAEHMKKYNIGTVAIGGKNSVVGLITDRDITIRVTAEGLDPTAVEVREVMTPNPVHVFEDQDLEDACLFMHDNKVRRLIVLNRQREAVGLLSLDDVAVKTRKRELAGYVLSSAAGQAK